MGGVWYRDGIMVVQADVPPGQVDLDSHFWIPTGHRPLPDFRSLHPQIGMMWYIIIYIWYGSPKIWMIWWLDHLWITYDQADLEKIPEPLSKDSGGCGFIGPELLQRLTAQLTQLPRQRRQQTTSLQVRIFGPRVGVLKGVLTLKHGIQTIQYPAPGMTWEMSSWWCWCQILVSVDRCG